ncbi:MAG: hypothetical protein MUP14_10190 [Dehalococcoidia bacterium]|nr:hypothetical protein [Dehalococcoidia bacterium]
MTKRWLIPAILLLAVGGLGLGVGWSINEWQDGNEASVPVRAGPTQAELDAQRCEAALEALGNAQPITHTDMRGTAQESIPQYATLKDAIDRYCH